MKKYYIYDVSPVGKLNLISNKKPVTQDFFEATLQNKLKEVASGREDKISEVQAEIESILNTGKTVTVLNNCFEISNEKTED